MLGCPVAQQDDITQVTQDIIRCLCTRDTLFNFFVLCFFDVIILQCLRETSHGL